eukprot:411372-Karenia_brevis.AAC.1
MIRAAHSTGTNSRRSPQTLRNQDVIQLLAIPFLLSLHCSCLEALAFWQESVYRFQTIIIHEA